eukprot:9680123-Alexandrium_andersonii.AAC.1
MASSPCSLVVRGGPPPQGLCTRSRCGAVRAIPGVATGGRPPGCLPVGGSCWLPCWAGPLVWPGHGVVVAVLRALWRSGVANAL